jgi:hypothetical protein
VKIEIDVPDVTEARLVEQMAETLLAEHDQYDEDGEPVADRWSRKKIGQQLRSYLDRKIAEMHETMVREHFDTVVKQRIEAAVDEVLQQGWTKTNEYGSAVGPKMMLRDRISEVLQSRDRYNSRNYIEEHVKAAADKLLAQEFAPLIKEAGVKLREMVDRAVLEQLAATVRGALGLK